MDFLFKSHEEKLELAKLSDLDRTILEAERFENAQTLTQKFRYQHEEEQKAKRAERELKMKEAAEQAKLNRQQQKQSKP